MAQAGEAALNAAAAGIKTGLISTNKRTAIKNTGSTSSEKAKIFESNREAAIWSAFNEGTITIKGRLDIEPLKDNINLNVYCEDGTPHYISGLYQVQKRVDEISGDFTTTLTVQKIGSGYDSYGYNVIPGMSPGVVGSGVQSARVNYGCKVPIIHGTGDGVEVVKLACQYVGNPYVWGGSSLTNGCDCSHFIWLILRETGRDYNYWTSGGWRNVGEPVPRDQVQAGDVMCYNGHVAFYIDSTHIVHAKGAKWGIVVDETDPFTYHGGAVTVRRVV